MLKIIKPHIITIIILLYSLLFFSCQTEEDVQTTDKPDLTEQQKCLVQELNNLLIPLNSSPLELSNEEMYFLHQFKDVKLIGLGEATHGTKEFFQMKQRIFQYLVEFCQHKAFGFEADFAESLYINNYVIKGEGDLENIMKSKMHFWTWKTKEVKQLLKWMRGYNSGKKENEKIHYFGFDCQFTTHQPELLQTYLLNTLPSLWDSASTVIGNVKTLSDNDYSGMSEETFNTIKNQLESLENQMINQKNQLISKSSPEEYKINQQLLKTFKQAFIVSYYNFQNWSSINWRDRFMAENALWIADFFGESTKITLWAHNYHISTAQFFNAMGYHIKNKIKNQYQTVGFSFSQGYFTAINNDSVLTTCEIITIPQIDSINFIFFHASDPNFAFDLKTIPSNSEWDNWLSLPRAFLSIGALFSGSAAKYYDYINIKQHHNIIIHINITTASERL